MKLYGSYTELQSYPSKGSTARDHGSRSSSPIREHTAGFQMDSTCGCMKSMAVHVTRALRSVPEVERPAGKGVPGLRKIRKGKSRAELSMTVQHQVLADIRQRITWNSAREAGEGNGE